MSRFAIPIILLAILAPLAPSAAHGADPSQYDLLVYGGTPSGIAAAVETARGGHSVLLVEPYRHVGGLVTNGLSHTDFRTFEGLNGAFHEFTERVQAYYREKYGPESPQARGTFRGTHAEPHVNLAVLEAMLAEQPSLRLLKQHSLAKVETSGEKTAFRVTGAEFRDSAGKLHRFGAKLFLDATYEGDLLAAAGLPYRVGREARAEYGESLAPVEADRAVQGYNFRYVMTRDPKIRVAIEPPAGYDREQFRDLIPLLEQGKFSSIFCQPTGGIYKYQTPPLPNNKFDINDVSRGLVRLSLPQVNDAWPEGDAATRAAIYQEHVRHNQGMLYFLQNDEAVPKKYRDDASQWGWCRDEFVENGHVPEQLYVREGRRLRGRYVFTENDTHCAEHDPRAVLRLEAVAMGDYGPNCHGTSHPGPRFGGRHEGEFYKQVAPYQIPYGVLLAEECENLLVSVACSASHVGFCALRLEPIWMSLGQAAGCAARQALDHGRSLHALDIPQLQRALHQRGAATIYVSDVPPRHEDFPAVQWWGTAGGLHGLTRRDFPAGQRGKNIHGQYYEPHPGHAAQLDRPLEAELRARWLELAEQLQLNPAPLRRAATRGEFLRAAYRQAVETPNDRNNP